MALKIQEVEFYNAGDARHEKFSFDQPASDKPHAISYWDMQAPKSGFFKVPMAMPSPFGGSVPVEFVNDILERYADRGVVAVDANGEFGPDEPWAANREEAKEKGARKWKTYLRNKIQDFHDENEQRVSRGLVKAKPSGFVVHAHRELGLAVPQEEVFVQAENNKSDVDEMKKQILELTALVKGGKK